MSLLHDVCGYSNFGCASLSPFVFWYNSIALKSVTGFVIQYAFVRCLTMKKLLLIAAVLAVAYIGVTQCGCVTQEHKVGVEPDSDQALAQAFANHQSNIEVHGNGIVTQLLADDNAGSRHQRFILRLKSGQTLLVAHNIDIANRIDSLKVGDQVAFKGEYEWNKMGGLIHFTHHDPEGRHSSGWIRHNGKNYQ